MEMLSLRTNMFNPKYNEIPIQVYTVGSEEQHSRTRAQGFSASQFIITFGGSGHFRLLEKEHLLPVTTGDLLYIPAGVPHEYVPSEKEIWRVGYVTCAHSSSSQVLKEWGYRDTPQIVHLHNIDRIALIIQAIWEKSGSCFDVWESSELLFSYLLELKKQSAVSNTTSTVSHRKPADDRELLVLSATKFLNDHMNHTVSIEDLAHQLGCSHKNLIRYFRRSYGMTPQAYLLHIRMTTSAELLVKQVQLSIASVASMVGMLPFYFTKKFKETHGCTPTEYRQKHFNQFG
ncbi:AraC family transcriptional regulator [Paenibacillus sp. GCM10023252]|uniref:helix-turn-helix transcriptional regulator n=1 Tax=Paenibacillus sp. GCM10023252 TaxID=3252649 RepID=UPI003613CD39